MRNRCLEVATEHPAVTWLNSVLSAPSLPRLEQVLSMDRQTVIDYAEWSQAMIRNKVSTAGANKEET
jgi:hypothetical protein